MIRIHVDAIGPAAAQFRLEIGNRGGHPQHKALLRDVAQLLQQGRPNGKGFRRRALGYHAHPDRSPRRAAIPQAAELGLEGLAEGGATRGQGDLAGNQAQGQGGQRQRGHRQRDQRQAVTTKTAPPHPCRLKFLTNS